MNEYQQYIRDTYEWAFRNKLVKNQSDFASVIGCNKVSLSLILRGKKSNNLSGKTIATRTKLWVKSNYPNKEQVSVLDYERGYNDAMKERDEFDWLSFRRQAAKDILCARLSTNGNHINFDYAKNRVCDSFSLQNYVGEAVSYADELIRQLKND